MNKSNIIILLSIVVLFLAFNESIPFDIPIDLPTKTPNAQDPIIKNSDDLTIASFNIQIFGNSKMDKPIAVENLPKIIKEFNIVGIQEIRDSSGDAIKELSNLLPKYQYIISDRLGRTSSKEQYAVFYNELNITNSEVYPDTYDVFEREPYIVYFSDGKNLSFSYILIHVKPDDVEREIIELKNVISYAQEKNQDQDFILTGDFNADCSYYDEDLNYLKEYEWVIDNSQDTTVGSNSCTYDRIITNGINTKSSGVYNFEQELSLSNDDAKIVSDHYPVWITI